MKIHVCKLKNLGPIKFSILDSSKNACLKGITQIENLCGLVNYLIIFL